MLFVCLSQENGRAVPVLVVVALSGVKVCDPDDQVTHTYNIPTYCHLNCRTTLHVIYNYKYFANTV